MPEQTKSFLYSVRNVVYDTSIECDLVRILRHRYSRRSEARKNLCGTKWIREAISNLRTYRQNRTINPARHEQLDREIMEARRARFFCVADSKIDTLNASIYWNCYHKLTQMDWSNVQTSITYIETAEQIPLF